MEGDKGLNDRHQALETPNVFTNMFSLLRPKHDQPSQDISIALPNIFKNLPASLGGEKKDKTGKACKINTACPHTDRKHYAKNMCNNCYHKLGRKKAVWLCPHEDRILYAKGKCQKCYIQEYNEAKIRSRSRERE